MAAIEHLENVHLPDTWVLSVDATDTSVCFVLDAALQEGHPRFYRPPKPGERNPHARLRWCLRGREVWWNDGPHLDRPAVDASGERNFGNIDAWWRESHVDHLEGDWGTVAIRDGAQTVEYLD